MKIKIQKQEIDLETEQLELIVKISGNLGELVNMDQMHGRDGLIRQIQYRLADIITDKIVEAKSEEIIKQIDLDYIIKQVQLKVISNISKN